MEDGESPVCERCGKVYHPRGSVGGWECRTHRAEADPHTGRYPCCQVQTCLGPTGLSIRSTRPYAEIRTTQDDLRGCYRGDHDLLPGTTPWPPYVLVTYYGLDHLDPVVQQRFDAVLTDRASYTAFAARRPDFQTQVAAALASDASFNTMIVTPLLLQALFNPLFYQHLERTAAAPPAATAGFQTQAIYVLLGQQLRAAAIAAGVDQRRVQFEDDRVVVLASLLNDVAGGALTIRGAEFWRRIREIVLILVTMGGESVHQVLLHQLATNLLADPAWPIIPVAAVLRVDRHQDSSTLGRVAAQRMW